jgi:protein O-GlcNAc transferase
MDQNQIEQEFQRGLCAHQTGNLGQASAHYEKVLDADPNHADAIHHLGLIRLARGDVHNAASAIERSLQLKPQNIEAQSNYIYVLNMAGKFEKAIAFYDGLHSVNERKSQDVVLNIANSHLELGRMNDARRLYQELLEHNPNNLPALYNLGRLEIRAQNYQHALEMLERAQQLSPNTPEILNNLSVAQRLHGQHERALSTASKAVSIDPANPSYLLNQALARKHGGDVSGAIDGLREVLLRYPDNSDATSSLGILLAEVRKYTEATDLLKRALKNARNKGPAYSDLAIALAHQDRLDEAFKLLDKGVVVDPTYANGWSNRGMVLGRLKRFQEAGESYGKAFQLRGHGEFDLGNAHHMLMMDCNWMGYEKYVRDIHVAVEGSLRCAEPFGYQAIADSEILLMKCATIYADARFPERADERLRGPQKREKIRIGYVSGEFREQATSILMAEVWESHDKDRFEIIAFDNGTSDNSLYRKRITTAFDSILDITGVSDEEAAAMVRSKGVDILVNLNGYFGKMRQELFARRAAPIQVNYLGFPGTLGAPYFDYLIADRVVIPYESRARYTEKIAYLPRCYQANDAKRKIAKTGLTRSQLGLPEDGFVFCSFNNSYKLTPLQFGLWCRILTEVPTGVLWLMLEGDVARDNLRQEAIQRGIDPSRIIFCERLAPSVHLERHALADLFLDTYPYNAHTTASDALWAGLPLLTRNGTTFPSRVAESLLKELNLTELVASDADDYVRRAIHIARNPGYLSALRTKLADQLKAGNRLFSGKDMAAHLEGVFLRMLERALCGLPPDHILPQEI